MKQFDVIVWSHEENPQFPSEPPFTDPALGWFFGNDINASIQESEAEWIVFAHASAKVDRTFLNDLAQAIESFPMVDAFAPRIATGKDGKFLAGYLRSGHKGFSMIPDDSKLRYVAAPTPYVAAFSRRIVRLTGGFDRSLSTAMGLVDFSLRMLHAGGKMFSIPYLCIGCESPNELLLPTANTNSKELGITLFKTFGFFGSFSFLLTHPGSIRPLWNNRKEINERRNSAILLSKLKADYIKEISC